MKEGASAGEGCLQSPCLPSAKERRDRRNPGHPRLKPRPCQWKNERLMLPRESPSRPVPMLKDPPRPGVQGASFGIIRRLSFQGWGGKRHPASFCGDLAGTFGKGFSPADAASAHRPEPRATDRNSVKEKGDEGFKN